MNRRLSLIIAAVMVIGWLVNLLAVDPQSELYPLTAWPMFSSTKPLDVGAVYEFHVWDRHGEGPSKLPAASMILPKRKANGKFTTRFVKAFASKAISSNRSTHVTNELADVWRFNARHFLKLHGPPRKVQFVRLDFDLTRTSSMLTEPVRTTILAEIGDSSIELASRESEFRHELD